VQFEQINTAAYSPRPGTIAATWATLQLSDETKQDRLQRINRLAAEHALARTNRFVGRIQEVLVEDINPKNAAQLVGRNPHGRLVYFIGNYQQWKGQIVPVKIIEAKAYSLVGELMMSKDEEERQ
jgi:tRNA-2-methylthio-N6-dimethylallyladenosine synthase